MKKKNHYFIILILSFGLLGCLPEEEPPLPVTTLSAPAPVHYETASVIIGDVIEYRNIRASVVPARVENLSFPTNDILISNVNVRVGDFVREGDVIVELERSFYLQELEQAIMDLEMAEVSLRQLGETQAYNVERARLTGTIVDTASYNRQRDAYNHEIDVLNIRITYLEDVLEQRVLRASMDGYVSFLFPFEEGEVTIADRRLVTIADMTETLFMVEGDRANLLKIGDQVDVYVGENVLTGIVIDPVEHNITADRSYYEAFVLILDGLQYGGMERGFGSIHLVLDTATDVLCIPSPLIHIYGDRVFVYVLEDGIPVLRYVEIGLVGNRFTEIISGLELGELVVYW